MIHSHESDSAEKRKESDDERSSTEPGTPENGTDAIRPNPPRTTTGRFFTAPKFGSAGSGGLELEPGPERD